MISAGLGSGRSGCDLNQVGDKLSCADGAWHALNLQCFLLTDAARRRLDIFVFCWALEFFGDTRRNCGPKRKPEDVLALSSSWDLTYNDVLEHLHISAVDNDWIEI